MTLESTDRTKTAIAKSAGLTHRGHVRQVNEDAFLDRGDHGLWVVADGMGGHDAGDVASRMIVETLRCVQLSGPLAERLNQIEDMLDQVNENLLERSSTTNGQKHIIGSTIALLAATDRRMGVVMWAGDSRIYRLRQGNLVQLSADHSQVETYIRQGLITREEARRHPERHIITRAVGSQEELYLEADLCEFSHGDRYLLCSDGLTRHVEDDEIRELLAQGTPEEACNKLLDLTLDRGARDNVTAVVVEID
ncbi:PP2C family protein-serine/threonine phosphatase [Marinospirillum alkaliphilum]|uniref:Serine/threonine protein phosphatase Stp1 n=1 Tax=Marinospirillum alkaliphilum DSM 21637 TaxID=1122209 RepID=A0A1K1ZAN7_9GAMM|nr:protein phosphatase 2C domain-containing protein [Marinospirillum alkaliphilum]SFX70755.1 serine/threonine protein phosphatase Stp1 [Marinospirillum alkaliphilum DSM 21637]